MTIRREPLPDVAPQPVAVSRAWRDLAIGDLRDLPGEEPTEDRAADEAG